MLCRGRSSCPFRPPSRGSWWDDNTNSRRLTGCVQSGYDLRLDFPRTQEARPCTAAISFPAVSLSEVPWSLPDSVPGEPQGKTEKAE